MADEPLSIWTGGRARPACPRCGSAMILIGRLTDEGGRSVRFTAEGANGPPREMGVIRSCYCNDCGEVTLTLA